MSKYDHWPCDERTVGISTLNIKQTLTHHYNTYFVDFIPINNYLNIIHNIGNNFYFDGHFFENNNIAKYFNRSKVNDILSKKRKTFINDQNTGVDAIIMISKIWPLPNHFNISQNIPRNSTEDIQHAENIETIWMQVKRSYMYDGLSLFYLILIHFFSDDYNKFFLNVYTTCRIDIMKILKEIEKEILHIKKKKKEKKEDIKSQTSYININEYPTIYANIFHLINGLVNQLNFLNSKKDCNINILLYSAPKYIYLKNSPVQVELLQKVQDNIKLQNLMKQILLSETVDDNRGKKVYTVIIIDNSLNCSNNLNKDNFNDFIFNIEINNYSIIYEPKMIEMIQMVKLASASVKFIWNPIQTLQYPKNMHENRKNFTSLIKINNRLFDLLSQTNTDFLEYCKIINIIKLSENTNANANAKKITDLYEHLLKEEMTLQQLNDDDDTSYDIDLKYLQLQKTDVNKIVKYLKFGVYK